MLDLKFGSSIGKKFNEDGSVRHFPGNTMVCILDHSSEVFRRAREERDLLYSLCGRTISVLPDESLHMTAIEGVCDQVRKKELWTSFLSLDCPLSDVDDFFEEAWKKVPPMGKVEMTFDHLWLESGCAIALRPASAEDEERIRGWRDRVSGIMGLRFPGHGKYMFHISLAYGMRMPDDAEMERFEREKERFDRQCKDSPFTFTVPQPSLTFFDDMFLFNPFRIPRKDKA